MSGPELVIWAIAIAIILALAWSAYRR